MLHNEGCDTSRNHKTKQDCIPVGCVPPAHWPSGRGACVLGGVHAQGAFVTMEGCACLGVCMLRWHACPRGCACLGVHACPGGLVCPGACMPTGCACPGVCVPRGVCVQGHACVPRGHVYPGSMCAWGACMLGGVCAWGMHTQRHACLGVGMHGAHAPCEQNHRCLWKHNLAATSLREVIKYVHKYKTLLAMIPNLAGQSYIQIL